MSADAEEQALMAALGFSSFGSTQRSSKRSRRSSPSPTGPLAQLAPGTELSGALPVSFPQSTRTVRGPHGVLSLVKAPQYDGNALKQALCGRPEGDSSATKACDARGKDERCGAELLERLQRAKTRFDALDSERFRAARSASNDFERIGRHRFLNRSAMKLATLDFVFGWTKTATESSEAFAFADICGGPGGFSEYLLWRLQRRVRNTSKTSEKQPKRVDGFGITLRDAANRCDWRLPSPLARVITTDESPVTESDDRGDDNDAENECTATFTICYGADGTGDLYSLANVCRFRDAVLERHPSGVSLAVADGGFLEARDRDNQEAMITRLVTAEALAMFSVLRPGGDFVCKTFELVTPAMRELVWFLHQCFSELAVVKPITSRPASSERYIIARNLHANLPLEDIIKRLETFAAAQVAACERIIEFAEKTPEEQAAMRGEQRRRVDPAKYYACWQLDDAESPGC